jgi:hypothetical protein
MSKDELCSQHNLMNCLNTIPFRQFCHFPTTLFERRANAAPSFIGPFPLD